MARLAAPGTRRASIAAAGVLAGAAIAWAAVPLHSARAGTRIALVLAVAAGALSIARLAVARLPRVAVPFLASAGRQLTERVFDVIGALPWAEAMLMGTLALEALHPVRPWHTGLLGLALLGYLLAVHLAETDAAPRALRGQLPLLAAGIVLLALAVGAAALPGRPSGPLAILAGGVTAVAVVTVAALVLPGAGRGGR